MGAREPATTIGCQAERMFQSLRWPDDQLILERLVLVSGQLFLFIFSFCRKKRRKNCVIHCAIHHWLCQTCVPSTKFVYGDIVTHVFNMYVCCLQCTMLLFIARCPASVKYNVHLRSYLFQIISIVTFGHDFRNAWSCDVCTVRVYDKYVV